MKISKDLLQCYTVQDITFSLLSELKDANGKSNLSLSQRTALLQKLVTSWDTIVERKRILRKTPLIKPIEHKPKPRKTRASVAPTVFNAPEQQPQDVDPTPPQPEQGISFAPPPVPAPLGGQGAG